MHMSENFFTKIRVGRHMKVPELLVDPTLWSVRDVLKDFFANRFVIFGTRGAGKLLSPARSLIPSVCRSKKNQNSLNQHKARK